MRGRGEQDEKVGREERDEMEVKRRSDSAFPQEMSTTVALCLWTKVKGKKYKLFF